jgi:hypothetical protein
MESSSTGRRLGQYRWKPISALFNERKATGAILEFSEKLVVGTMRGRHRMGGACRGLEIRARFNVWRHGQVFIFFLCYYFRWKQGVEGAAVDTLK